jgi:predicted acylesterase/phospholipase RssA
MKREHYNIVTLDGGGFLGIISILLIEDLIASIDGFLDRVDLFGGTSTGAIISIGLASRLMNAADLINFYETKGPQVFQDYKPDLPLGLCSHFPELCYPKYTNVGQIEALKPYYGEATFDDLKNNALVTSFVLSNEKDVRWHPVAFHNLPGTPFSGVKLLDAIMSSSSPPVMFPPYPIRIPEKCWCVDGAVFANNPTSFTLAHVHRLRILEARNMDNGHLRLLSIGTGAKHNTIPFAGFGSPFEWGIYRWLNPFASSPEPRFPLPMAFWDGQSAVDDFQAEMFLGEHRYRRANPVLHEAFALDDYKAVPRLEELTREYIASSHWTSIKQWVEREFS